MNEIFNIRIEFILFALTLTGIAIFHRHTMYVSLAGMLIILLSKFILSDDFSLAEHFIGTSADKGEWSTFVNLGGLLLGFAILARYFEDSSLPERIPDILPSGWPGGLVLLLSIMVLSSFLDNIAAAMLGGTLAGVVYRGKVHPAYLASIIAASNAGGAGSVIGDTTTTLMWIDGISPANLFPAFIGSAGAFLLFGFAGAYMQNIYLRKEAVNVVEFTPVPNPSSQKSNISYKHLLIVILIIFGAILTNYLLSFPALGIWIIIILSSFFIKFPWYALKKSLTGTVFLLALVTSASLMPVEELPEASGFTTLMLGILSSVFDNIPLTKLCLEQGGYNWALLAFAVGFGGSMIWFGSSAGVALSNLYPVIRSTGLYLKNSWHVIISYFIGFAMILLFYMNGK